MREAPQPHGSWSFPYAIPFLSYRKRSPALEGNAVRRYRRRMTAKLRKRFVRAMFAVACAVAVATAAGLVLGDGSSSVWSQAAGSDAGIVSLAGAGLCALASLTVLTLFALKAGASVSPELFFFSLWAFGLVFELGRPLGALAFGWSPGLLPLFMRMTLFGRYLCVLAPVLGSVFSVGLGHERTGMLAGVTGSAALFFAAMHPLSNAGPLGGFGYVGLMRTFEGALTLLALVNYVLAWKEHRDKSYAYAGLALFACVAASWALRYGQSWIPVAAGTLVLGVGAFAHMKTLYASYLWR